MRRCFGIAAVLFLILWANSSAAINCRKGANFYNRAKSESDLRQVIAWLYKSVEVCPNFNAWYMLGVIHARRGEAVRALDAFTYARAVAGSSKAEALALARRGELLTSQGQLSRAVHELELAKRFHPEPTPVWLEESLKNARVRTYQGIVSANNIANTLIAGTQFSRDGRFAVRPAVNLPVHFEFDRADLNSAARRQVLELGRALTIAKMKQRSFLLVGHTDKRGSQAYNQVLSDQRALTVRAELERRFPSLSGRLEAEGRGETELLYDGESEIDHMLNRRVKVTLYE